MRVRHFDNCSPTFKQIEKGSSLSTLRSRVHQGGSGYMMEAQSCKNASSGTRVKARFFLGSETYSVEGNKGILSEQLVSMKEESMSVLKDFITKHNVPNDVPDEPEEISSEDDGEIPENVHVKSKKRK